MLHPIYYRQDRGAEYKASPPGWAMSPALSHHVTHCTQVNPPPSVAIVSVFLSELNLSF